MTKRFLTPDRQSGVAIVTALLVVMLAASVAVFLLAQQSQALSRTQHATARAQISLYTRPTLDWTRSMLTESLKNAAYVTAKQDWSTNLAAQPIEGAVASGYLSDEQARFNLNNLIIDGKKSAADILLFRALLKQLNLNQDLANAAADWIDTDDDVTSPGGAENSTYFAMNPPRRAANSKNGFSQMEELLRVQGFDAATMRVLAPHITVLRQRTAVNINTASATMLSAVLSLAPTPFTPDQIAGIIHHREATPFANKMDIKSYIKDPIPPALVDQYLDSTSIYFSVNLAITGDGAQIRQQALLERNAAVLAEWPRIIWVKDL